MGERAATGLDRTSPQVLENRHTGERLVLRRVVPEEGPDYIEIRGSLPPDSEGPPPHAHPLQVEEGVVRRGTITLMIDDDVHELGPGEPLLIPAGAVHSWWNSGEETLEFEARITPSLEFDRILSAFFDATNRSESGRPSLLESARLLRAHREEYHFHGMPRPLQALLFPPLAALAKLLQIGG